MHEEKIKLIFIGERFSETLGATSVKKPFDP